MITSSGFSSRIKFSFNRFLSRFEQKYKVYEYELEIYLLNEWLTCEVTFLFSFSIHKDHSFFCDVCNFCLDKGLEGRYRCRPNSGYDECCICLEVMTNPVLRQNLKRRGSLCFVRFIVFRVCREHLLIIVVSVCKFRLQLYRLHFILNFYIAVKCSVICYVLSKNSDLQVNVYVLLLQKGRLLWILLESNSYISKFSFPLMPVFQTFFSRTHSVVVLSYHVHTSFTESVLIQKLKLSV